MSLVDTRRSLARLVRIRVGLSARFGALGALSDDPLIEILQRQDAAIVRVEPRITCDQTLNDALAPLRIERKVRRDLKVVGFVARDCLGYPKLRQDGIGVPAT